MLKKLGKKLLWVIFLISFIPYIYLGFVSIFGANIGLFSFQYAYGGEAVATMATLLCIVPIIPLCFIIQGLYYVFLLRHASQTRKKGILIFVISIVALILIATSIHDTYKLMSNKKFYNENYPRVEEYMRTRFSPEIVDSSTVYSYDRKENNFKIFIDCDLGSLRESDVNKVLVNFSINEDKSVTDDLPLHFYSVNNKLFAEKLNSYIAESNNLPEGWNVGVELIDIDFTEYTLGTLDEDVFPYCKYSLGSIYINADHYDMDEALEAISLYREQYAEGFGINNPNFYVKVDGEFYASIHVINEDNGYLLIFRGYTSGDGQTIPNTEWEVIE